MFVLKQRWEGHKNVIGKPFGSSINFTGKDGEITVRATKHIPEHKKTIRGATPQEIEQAVRSNPGYAKLFDFVKKENNVEIRIDAIKYLKEEEANKAKEYSKIESVATSSTKNSGSSK